MSVPGVNLPGPLALGNIGTSSTATTAVTLGSAATPQVVVTNDATNPSVAITSAGTGNVVINGQTFLPAASAVLSTALTFSGALSPSQALTATATKLGSIVTLHIPATAATTGVASVITSTALPTGWRPSGLVYFPIAIVNNATNALGFMAITTAGVITIGVGLTVSTANPPLPSGAFTVTANCGWANEIVVTFPTA